MESLLVQPLVLQRHLITDRLSRDLKASATSGLVQKRHLVGSGPDFNDLDPLSVAAVLGLELKCGCDSCGNLFRFSLYEQPRKPIQNRVRFWSCF
jgi:hypothetical protein